MNLVELAFFTDNVADMPRFYQRLLNSEPVAHSDDMAIFMVGATKILIHRKYTPTEGELPPDNHMAFAVADVDATTDELIRQGLVVEVAPREFYWGRSAYLRDPEGHQIEVTTAKKATHE